MCSFTPEKKLCPIKFNQVKLFAAENIIDDGPFCDDVLCAWWIESRSKCAVAATLRFAQIDVLPPTEIGMSEVDLAREAAKNIDELSGPGPESAHCGDI